MPSRPLRPCTRPGCATLVPRGRCPAHHKEQRKQEDSVRLPSRARGYSTAWEKASKGYLRDHPICECDDCRATGRVLPATVVDHTEPHRGDQGKFWNKANWRAMAKTCHDRKTARQDGGFGNRRTA